jgi:DNA-binding PadR family transcriptional regulator
VSWNEWRQKRRADARARVITCLRVKSGLSGYQLMKDTHLRGARLYVALGELERDGEITGRWVDGPYPRRRLYQLAERRKS